MVVLKPRLEVLKGPVIEVYTDFGPMDLHNHADFKSLYYDTDDCVILTWKAFDTQEFKFDGRRVEKASLIFKGILQFSATPFDEEVPKIENKNLEHLELFRDGGSIAGNFVFNNGTEVSIRSLDLDLEIDLYLK